MSDCMHVFEKVNQPHSGQLSLAIPPGVVAAISESSIERKQAGTPYDALEHICARWLRREISGYFFKHLRSRRDLGFVGVSGTDHKLTDGLSLLHCHTWSTTRWDDPVITAWYRYSSLLAVPPVRLRVSAAGRWVVAIFRLARFDDSPRQAPYSANITNLLPSKQTWSRLTACARTSKAETYWAI